MGENILYRNSECGFKYHLCAYGTCGKSLDILPTIKTVCLIMMVGVQSDPCVRCLGKHNSEARVAVSYLISALVFASCLGASLKGQVHTLKANLGTLPTPMQGNTTYLLS